MAQEVAEHILEREQKLSESILWRLQRDFYDQSGVNAWNSGVVPHYVTNNPSIARAYLRVFLGFLRDLCREHDRRPEGAPALLDPEQPVYVMELGAGAGRFAYQFLKALVEHEDADPFQRLKVCYVMADFTRSNLDFWMAHPQLRPFVDQGLLDFAILDAEHDRQIRLERSGLVLSRETMRNPLTTFGNYLFDTLTADAFQVQGGRLMESLVTVFSEGPVEMEGDQSELLARLKVRYDHREVGPEYYPDPDWNRVLAGYRESLGDTSLSIPVGAFRCVDNLLEISGGRMLFLASDKAWNRAEELCGLDDPQPILHGSFSLTVNFHALGRLFEVRGGTALQSDIRDSLLDQVVLLQDPLLADTRELRLAFAEFINAFGPVDFFHLKEGLATDLPRPSLRVAMELLRLSSWDPDVFYALSEAMATQIEGASQVVKRELAECIERIWACYYHFGAEKDVAFELARLCYRLDRYQDSLRFYELSLELFGDHKMTRHNMGLAHYYMCDLEAALDSFRKALELDPSYGVSRDWILRIESEQASRAELRRAAVGAR